MKGLPLQPAAPEWVDLGAQSLRGLELLGVVGRSKRIIHGPFIVPPEVL